MKNARKEQRLQMLIARVPNNSGAPDYISSGEYFIPVKCALNGFEMAVLRHAVSLRVAYVVRQND